MNKLKDNKIEIKYLIIFLVLIVAAFITIFCLQKNVEVINTEYDFFKLKRYDLSIKNVHYIFEEVKLTDLVATDKLDEFFNKQDELIKEAKKYVKDNSKKSNVNNGMKIVTRINYENIDNLLSINLKSDLYNSIDVSAKKETKNESMEVINIDYVNKQVLSNQEILERFNISIEEVSNILYEEFNKKYDSFKGYFTADGVKRTQDEYVVNREEYIKNIRIYINHLKFTILDGKLVVLYDEREACLATQLFSGMEYSKSYNYVIINDILEQK